jgi:hypothetical protein
MTWEEGVEKSKLASEFINRYIIEALDTANSRERLLLICMSICVAQTQLLLPSLILVNFRRQVSRRRLIKF